MGMTAEWSAQFSSLSDCFRRHQAFVNGLIYDRCGDAAIAEEVTAQTFEAAAVRFARGRGDEVTPAWLAVVARRRLIDHWRRTSARQRAFERVSREPATTIDESPDDDLRVTTALDSLPQRQRTVLTLRHIDGWSVGEIAAGLGITYLAAESLLSRSRRSFANALAHSQRLVSAPARPRGSQ
jgi:RNA polymerase sigma-70 factor (ECF subfamily)